MLLKGSHKIRAEMFSKVERDGLGLGESSFSGVLVGLVKCVQEDR